MLVFFLRGFRNFYFYFIKKEIAKRLQKNEILEESVDEDFNLALYLQEQEKVINKLKILKGHFKYSFFLNRRKFKCKQK